MEKENNIELNNSSVNENSNSKIISIDEIIQKLIKFEISSKEEEEKTIKLSSHNLTKDDFRGLFNPKDSLSFSNTNDIIQKYLNLDLELLVDDEMGFRLEGSVQITMEIINSNLKMIILDTAETLNISYLEIEYNNQIFENISYKTLKNNFYQDAGNPLIIYLPEEIQKSLTSLKDGEFLSSKETTKTLKLFIYYEAIQSSMWVYTQTKYTKDKKAPFAYMLNEPIGSRSCFPCQDTPSAKIKFQANLKAEVPLTAFTSGILEKTEEIVKDKSITKRVFTYKQNNPIPSYLLVFAVGFVETVTINERIKIFCEPSLAKKAKENYSDLDEIIKHAESLLSPYVWGEFNIILIPNFKYTGMENPNLIYIDEKSIGSKTLIIHELVHSWFGNLVTNKNWENFWLNEGITTFIEGKITRLVYGEETYFDLIEGKNDSLKSLINHFGVESTHTSLHPELNHENLLKNYSMLPYYKGALFLRYIEKLISEKHIMFILNELVKKYSFQSIDYVDLKVFFDEKIKEISKEENSSELEAAYQQVNWDQWVLKPGYPVYFD